MRFAADGYFCHLRDKIDSQIFGKAFSFFYTFENSLSVKPDHQSMSFRVKAVISHVFLSINNLAHISKTRSPIILWLMSCLPEVWSSIMCRIKFTLKSPLPSNSLLNRSEETSSFNSRLNQVPKGRVNPCFLCFSIFFGSMPPTAFLSMYLVLNPFIFSSNGILDANSTTL